MADIGPTEFWLQKIFNATAKFVDQKRQRKLENSLKFSRYGSVDLERPWTTITILFFWIR
jgi:hypothetical protein